MALNAFDVSIFFCCFSFCASFVWLRLVHDVNDDDDVKPVNGNNLFFIYFADLNSNYTKQVRE